MRGLLLLTALALALWCTEGQSISIPGDEGVEEDDSDGGQLWALLVAGSSGWYNYRHQADVCHAYQILHQHGVPDDHIIVMMYDDVAYDPENPTPGVIINRPNGPNVYEGVLKDYTGDDVTPRNFLNILKGNASAMAGIGSGKVVNSTHRDRIFINLVDHGAPGLFGFPDEVLHATALSRTIKHLHKHRKFKEMVIYLEACESGSMFKDLLPDDAKVYALSASSPNEPSYACYMDENLDNYLGDVFSIKWMEDTDRENIHHETLKRQFHLVRREVTTSTVMQWGEWDLNSQKLWEFMGEKDKATAMHSEGYHADDGSNTTHGEGVSSAVAAMQLEEHHDAKVPDKEVYYPGVLSTKVHDTEIQNPEVHDTEFHDTVVQKIQKSYRKQVDKPTVSSEVHKLQEYKKEDDRRVNSIRFPREVRKDFPEPVNSIAENETVPEKKDADAVITNGTESASDLDVQKMDDDDDPCLDSAVASPDVPVAILRSRIRKSKGSDREQHWKSELTTLHLTRMLVNAVVQSLVKQVTDDEEMKEIIVKDGRNITNWECYDRSVDIFHETCFNLGQNPYALRQMQVLVNLCEHGYTADMLQEAAELVCRYLNFPKIH